MCWLQWAERLLCKFRAFMKICFSTLFILLLALSLRAPAWAEKADRNKSMSIESETLRYDDVRQISVFTGHVVLTKGSILIRGAQLEVRQDADGFQFGRVTGGAEQTAFFRQKREGLDEFIEGEGETIYYDGRADTITFTTKAQLRRYRGTTLADQISGAVIVYENLTDLFKVDGSASTAGGAGGAPGSGRVRAILTPKPDDTSGGGTVAPARSGAGAVQ